MTGGTTSVGITERLAAIHELISAAARRADRDPSEITLTAVSKTFPREEVDAAYELGLRVFGENRVQEISAKFRDPLPDDAAVHLIGPLQTNKVRQVIPLVKRIETVDRMSLIESLAKELPRQGLICSVLIQVNVAGETQKSGCTLEEAEALLTRVRDVPELRCDGFMTMAPYVDDPQTIRPVFAALRALRDQLRESSGMDLPVLSMGMSGNFPIAIEEGATHVRIGRSLFGER